jgi:hypothetical protein
MSATPIRKRVDSIAWAEARIAERRSPLHAKLTTTHAHRHSAHGSQGGDVTHSHEHSHSGDSTHDHHDPGGNDEAATAYSTSSLSAGDWDLEARVRIARLKGEPAPSPLTPEERFRVMEWEMERIVARRRAEVEELRKGPR